MARRRSRDVSTTASHTPCEPFTVLQRVGWALFALQLLALGAWKTFMFSRFSGTLDENEYQQSLYLISRGIFNPVTTAWGRPFLHDHGSIFLWLLAPLDFLHPVGLYVLLAGVTCVVVAEVVAFRWMLDVVRARAAQPGVDRTQLQVVAGLGLCVLVLNPWTWWVISFDVHGELFAAPFIILAARAFAQSRYRAGWCWVLATLSIGAIVSSWIAGLALSALVAGFFERQRRRTLWLTGAGLVGAGLGSLLLLSALGLDNGSNLNTLYGYLTVRAGQPIPHKLGPGKLLVSLATHPWRVVQGLLNHLQDLYANLAPTGWVGVLAPWTCGVPLTILLENNLVYGFRFSGPIFQSVPVYTFSAVGLVLVLVHVTRHHARRVATIVAAGLLSVNCLVWGLVFWPHLEQQWVSVSASQARVLDQISHEIPSSDEVIMSQGEIARFSMRRYIYGSTNQYHWPVHTRSVWFIVTPYAGVEFSLIHDLTVIQRLAANPDATLVENTDGIYLFHLELPASAHELNLGHPGHVVSGALAVGPAGAARQFGPTATWAAVSTPRAGYVVAHDYWELRRGTYRVRLQLSNATPVNVEVWNTDGQTLLARSSLTPAPNVHVVTLVFTLANLDTPLEAFRGWGAWRVQWKPQGSEGENEVEVRVWSPGGVGDSITQLSVARDSRHY